MSHRSALTPARRSVRAVTFAAALSAAMAAGLLVGASGALADDVGSNPPTIPATTVAPLSLGGGSTTPAASTPVATTPGTPTTVASAGAAYERARTLIAAKDWAGAVTALAEADKLQPNNADVQNLLGYSNRKLGNLDKALLHYANAIKLDPKHLGAHEYLGEAYLLLNNPSKAKAELATLKKLCGVKCEQYLDLSKAIKTYKPVKVTKKK